MVEKTECGVGVPSDVLKRYFIRLRVFHFIGHKVEKTESRSNIVIKSQQLLLNESNRVKIRSFLRLDIDRLDCKRFAHVYYQTPSFPLYHVFTNQSEIFTCRVC